MTEGAALEVDGADRLSRTLKAAEASLGDLSQPSQAAGSIVASAARARAPRRTGVLAGSIVTTSTEGGVAVQATARYAGPIHWGWPARGIKAQPFLSDAGRATEPQWVARYEDDVNKTLERVEGA
jgi:hypothetical protein